MDREIARVADLVETLKHDIEINPTRFPQSQIVRSPTGAGLMSAMLSIAATTQDSTEAC
jgi:hypothetical protein